MTDPTPPLGPLPEPVEVSRVHRPGELRITRAYTTAQMQTERRRCYELGAAAERELWEKALAQAWRMVDPLKPAGTPGSYARGQDSGITAALQTVRDNRAALDKPQRAEPGKDAA